MVFFAMPLFYVVFFLSLDHIRQQIPMNEWMNKEKSIVVFSWIDLNIFYLCCTSTDTRKLFSFQSQNSIQFRWKFYQFFASFYSLSKLYNKAILISLNHYFCLSNSHNTTPFTIHIIQTIFTNNSFDTVWYFDIPLICKVK